MEILENRAQWEKTYRQTWLAHLEQTGQIDWKLYPLPKNRHTPAAPGVTLSKSRLLLISTAGAYLSGRQQPFDAANLTGDYTVRKFSTATPFSALAYAHDHYDQAMIQRDPQVALPLRHLQDLVTAGRISSLTPSVASFMGYQPDAARAVDQLVPRILAIAKEERAQAVLLAPL